MSSAQRRQSGFTLLEVLIAISILTMFAIGGFAALNGAIKTRSKVETELQALGDLQRAMLMLSTDLNSARSRPMRDRYGEKLPALIGSVNRDKFLEFTRGGVRRPAALVGDFSNLQRIAYTLEDERLWRYRWSVLDQAQDSEPLATPLMAGVESIELKFYNADLQESSEWPKLQRGDERELEAVPPPAGLEMLIITKKWGEIRRVFIVNPGAEEPSEDQRNES